MSCYSLMDVGSQAVVFLALSAPDGCFQRFSAYHCRAAAHEDFEQLEP